MTVTRTTYPAISEGEADARVTAGTSADTAAVNAVAAATVQAGAAAGATALQAGDAEAEVATATGAGNLATNDGAGGITGTAPGTFATAAQGATADAALQPGDVRRVVAEVEMASDVSYNLAATTAIAPLTVSFTAVAGTHVVNLHLFNSQTVAVGLRRLYFRVDGGAWVMFGWDGKYSGQGTNTVCSRLVVLGAGAAQIDVAIAVVAGTVNVLGSTEVPSRLFIEGP